MVNRETQTLYADSEFLIFLLLTIDLKKKKNSSFAFISMKVVHTIKSFSCKFAIIFIDEIA